MKKVIMFIVSLFAVANVMAQNVVSCEFTSISSDITSNTTLTAGTLYRLEGCIHVTNGNTLTIPAGTTIMGEKSSNATLIIDEGATLNVNGTSGSPVIFTSDQTPTNKNYGDWGGLVIEGKAPNNVSGGTISLTGRTCSASGGGTSCTDNSGTLSYLRIEYATNGLTLLSVGSGTTINNVQTSFIDNNAFEFLGGILRAKYLISYNAKGNDFLADFGTQTLVQFAVSIRRDPNAHLSTGSNAVVMSNNETSPYTSTPLTHFVMSDASILGPYNCGAAGVSGDFKYGVLYHHNTTGGIYNSLTAYWYDGLYMDDNSTLQNADVNYTLNFSANSFYGNANLDYEQAAGTTWPANCSADLPTWITNGGGSFCSQPDNQFQPYTLGYSATICGTYSSTPPSFVLGTTDLDPVDYSASDLSDPFFTTTGTRYHGGFNTSTDWTTGWTNWDPQDFNPCPEERNPTSVSNINNTNVTSLQLAPNPSNGTTFAIFNVAQSGNVSISVIDNVGRTIHVINSSMDKGNQRIAINTEGLAAGIYTIKVTTGNGNPMYSDLLVK